MSHLSMLELDTFTCIWWRRKSRVDLSTRFTHKVEIGGFRGSYCVVSRTNVGMLSIAVTVFEVPGVYDVYLT